MRLYTIGFTGKSARELFTILKHSDVKKVIDVHGIFFFKSERKWNISRVCIVIYMVETGNQAENCRKGQATEDEDQADRRGYAQSGQGEEGGLLFHCRQCP